MPAIEIFNPRLENLKKLLPFPAVPWIVFMQTISYEWLFFLRTPAYNNILSSKQTLVYIFCKQVHNSLRHRT